MAKVGAQRAAELTGKSKSTIQRAMNSGKLSFEKDGNDRRLVDVSELERVFGLKPQGSQDTPERVEVIGNMTAELAIEKARHELEIEKLKMEARLIQDQLDQANQQIDDLKVQRDLWQKQAQQILITSQYSQKQSEERIAEMRAKEEARKQVMNQRRAQQGSVPHRAAATPANNVKTVKTAHPARPNNTTAAPQSTTQNQGPVFRTIEPGNQNRVVAEPQKASFFSTLFGGNKSKRA